MISEEAIAGREGAEERPVELSGETSSTSESGTVLVATDDGLGMDHRGAAGNVRSGADAAVRPPASGRAAIVQLEAARWAGADYLRVSRTAQWWLDLFPEFAAHVGRTYEQLPRSDTGEEIWNLRRQGEWVEVDDQLDHLAVGSDESPALLVWRSTRSLEGMLPHCRVFRPLSDESPLPYLDHTIDVVAVGDRAGATLDEAMRVAISAVIDISAEPSVVWRASREAASTIAVALICGANGLPDARWLSVFAEDLPRWMDTEILVLGPESRVPGAREAPLPFPYRTVEAHDDLRDLDIVSLAVDSARNEVVVLVDVRMAAVRGSIAALVSLLHSSDDIAVVSAAVVDAAGRWAPRAGAPAGSALDDIETPARNVTREVEHDSLAFAAVRRGPYLAARAAMAADSGPSVPALGAALRQTGMRWLATPEALAISARQL